jgi:ADP-ribose pyrophosphatase
MAAEAEESAADPAGGFTRHSPESLHAWAWWELLRGEFLSPDGESFERTWVRSPGAVGVVAVDDSDRVVLVRQYRPALHSLTWEIPAGLRDVPGEDPAATARRELQEEVGVTAVSIVPLGRIMSAPGISDSEVSLYLAEGLRTVEATPHGPEERHMTVHWLPFDEALRMAEDGDITDSKTVAGLLLASRRR